MTNVIQWLKNLAARLSDRAGLLAARFSRKPAAPTTTTTPQFVSPDPTIGLFGAADAGEESAGRLPLRTLLEKSVYEMDERTAALKERADYLVSRLADRAEGEVTLITQGLRFLIGSLWVGVAFWLYFSIAGLAPDNMSALSSGMPAEDAMTLVRVFFPLGVVGLGVAMLVVTILNITGNAGNERVRREAEDLGGFIAETALDFDRDLTRLRQAMDDRRNHTDAIDDLSRSHVTALKAWTFFQDVSFITSPDGAEADRAFRSFLRRPQSQPAGPIFVLGFLVGALAAVVLFVPKPEIILPAPPEIAKYPWAANLVMFGALFYAMAGLFVSAFGSLVSGGAVARARTEALDVLRGVFTAREAPRPADIVRRISDAIDVFRARVGGRGAGANQPAAGLTDADAEIPEWRRRDSSVKFVDKGFQAAPARWRTDAYEENFTRKPEAKRDLKGLEKGSRD